jgi:hypothetical protein
MQVPKRASSLLVEARGVLYLIGIVYSGGVDDSARHYDDVWQWRPAWGKLVIRNPEVFSPRSGHVGFAVGNSVYVYGGQEEPQPGTDLGGRIYAEWLRLDLEHLEWTVVSPPPQVLGRHSASLTYMSARDQALVFGGCSSSGLENSLYLFDLGQF